MQEHVSLLRYIASSFVPYSSPRCFIITSVISHFRCQYLVHSNIWVSLLFVLPFSLFFSVLLFCCGLCCVCILDGLHSFIHSIHNIWSIDYPLRANQHRYSKFRFIHADLTLGKRTLGNILCVQFTRLILPFNHCLRGLSGKYLTIFNISRTGGVTLMNLGSQSEKTYCASVNSHSPVGLVSRQWDAVDWVCVLCDRRIHKSPPLWMAILALGKPRSSTEPNLGRRGGGMTDLGDVMLCQ